VIVLEHLADVVAELLRADERRVLLGEDVADGGMLGLSRRAIEDESSRLRVVSTPLVPTIAAAHAAGMAAAGRRPLVLLPSVAALVEGLAGLREAAALQWRTDGARSAPVLFVAPCGPGFGLGGDAVEAPEAIVTRIAGLRVLCVGRTIDAAPMLRAAAEHWLGEEPTVLLVPRSILVEEFDEPPPSTLERPLGAAHVLRAGRAATVFAWGEMVDVALRAAERSGHDVGVVDVVSLAPIDREGLVEAARTTGKLVIAHAGPAAHGVGAELAALFADRAILHLDAPVTRVTGRDAPLLACNEADAIPGVQRLTDAIVEVATY
jgi:pyruvate/2-oxoglutarate/acetoin dehydrogenase E1 component